MSTNDAVLYHQRVKFCQPYVEFMTQVATLISARKLSAAALSGHLRRQLERVKDYGLQAKQDPVAVDEALFAVCAWADEQIMNAQWDGVSEYWAQTLLQMEYFNTNLAGELFFERMEALPPEASPAQSVYAMCLANGFKGKYVFNLSVDELESKRQQAINGALIDVGLINPGAQTFPSIGELAHLGPTAPTNWRKYLPIGISLLLLVILTLILAGVLQLNIAIVLGQWL
jgi:type VI secretion system protein ImpK